MTAASHSIMPMTSHGNITAASTGICTAASPGIGTIIKKCILVLVYPSSYSKFGSPWSRTQSSYRSLDRPWTAGSLVDCWIVRGSSQGSRTVGSPLDRWPCRAILDGSVLTWIAYCAWSFPRQFLTLLLISFIRLAIHLFATPFIHPLFSSCLHLSIHLFVYQFICSFIAYFIH